MKKKILVLAIAVALIAVAAIGGSLAWMTSTAEAKNTFTVGNVKIKLDEPTWVENSKLVPGTTISKDPTVTVMADSEECYVRLLVTINNQNDLDKIFDTGLDLSTFFKGYDAITWLYKGETKNADDTRTYEFRYKAIVPYSESNTKLDSLFTGVVVPGTVDNDELASISDLSISIVAEAIQSANMTSEDDAWLAFPTK